jgi:pilus retraction protein PilT
MSATFNDYVLTTSLEQGWVTPEQVEQVRVVLAANPAVAALDLMEEQQLLLAEHVKTLRDLIGQAGEDSEQDPSVVRAYLEAAVQMGASDLHLGPDAPALVRVHGQLAPLEGPSARILNKTETEQLARSFLTPKQTARVEEYGSVDYCYDAPGLSRFRTSVVRQRRGWESVFRVISSKIRTMDELGLPPVLKTLTRYHNGLVLVTGAVGSGKSTTLAAMVDHINKERKDHIITLEDPIEYVFTPAGCQVSQREIGTNSQSFSSALRASLREDPEVIMVGEMRDLETISLAITASETTEGYIVEVASTVTADYAPGRYQWSAFITRTSDGARAEVGYGSFEVGANRATSTDDPRSFAQIALDNIEAYLKDPNNLQAASYSVAGRSLSRWNRADLLTERDRMKAEVNREKQAEKLRQGLGTNQTIRVRFTK